MAASSALAACAPKATPVSTALRKAPKPAGPGWSTAPSSAKPSKLLFIYWPWGTTEAELCDQSVVFDGKTWALPYYQSFFTAPESLELRYIPTAKAFWTEEYSFHPVMHHYYFSPMNSQKESPIAGRVHNWLLPNDSATLGWTAMEAMGANAGNKEWAWMPQQYVGGKTRDGNCTIALKYGVDAMLGSGFRPVNANPAIKELWKKWMDVDLNLKQWDKATAVHLAVPALMKAWYSKWNDAAVVSIQNCLAGKITPDQASDEMIAKHKEVA